MQYVVQLELAPEGVLELSDDNPEPTDENMAEELAYRDKFLARAEPVLAALPLQPIHHSGNVSDVRLLGSEEWSRLNRYLLILTVDIGTPRLDVDALAGTGGTATVVGGFTELARLTNTPSS